MARGPTTSDRLVPLVFDIDRTLVVDDTLELSLMRMLRRQRRNLLRLLWRLPATGWAGFKRDLFARADVQADELLFDPAVRGHLEQAREAGREVWIATASPQSIADRVADALGVPRERAIGTGAENLKGARKAAALVARFGRGGFDYVGDSPADRAVWAESREAIVVARTGAMRRRGERLPNKGAVLDRTQQGMRLVDWWRLLRPYQWPKNVLVFLPLFTAHRWGDLTAWLQGMWAFGALSLAASSVYAVNDALDWSTDRRHPRKSKRPIAAGRIRPAAAFAIAGTLVVLALAVAWWHSAMLAVCVAGYLLLATSYSFYLKQRLLLDTVVLSHFYIARIVSGGVAMGIVLSPWLLSFAGFAFFSLAMVKRYSELKQTEAAGRTHNELRGYTPADLPILGALGVGAGLIACLVLALYLSSETVSSLYEQPAVLWAACPLFFYWVGRIWLLASRGTDIEDPVSFALRDRVSYVVLAAMVLAVLAATLFSAALG